MLGWKNACESCCQLFSNPTLESLQSGIPIVRFSRSPNTEASGLSLSGLSTRN
jgi:hypothetical protein